MADAFQWWPSCLTVMEAMSSTRTGQTHLASGVAWRDSGDSSNTVFADLHKSFFQRSLACSSQWNELIDESNGCIPAITLSQSGSLCLHLSNIIDFSSLHTCINGKKKSCPFSHWVLSKNLSNIRFKLKLFQWPHLVPFMLFHTFLQAWFLYGLNNPQ